MFTVVRPAEITDRDAILSIVQQSFSGPDHDGTEEVDIVTETWERRASPSGLELVAADGDVIVGHVLAAVGDLGGRPSVGIAPLSVVPQRQRQGVGSTLMVELLARIERDGWPLTVLLGDPRYYHRFGFEPSASHGITYPPVGPGNPHFMVRTFGSPPAKLSGDFTYCWELPSS
jgi:predicted N-acetyltransferase YhbS